MCPIDQTVLEVKAGVKCCPQCGGQLFLKGEFEQYLDAAKQPNPDDVTDKLKAIVAEHPVAAGYNNADGRACPNCSTPMLKQNYSYDSNVFINHCPQCGATWLDKNEAAKMVAYLAASNEFAQVGDSVGEEATRDYFYRSAADASEASRVYPYSPERTAALGLVGGHPEIQYREYSTMASLVRWPLLWWAARGLTILTWIAYIVISETRSTGLTFVSITVMAACYIAMAQMSRWAKKERALMREAEKRPFEKP